MICAVTFVLDKSQFFSGVLFCKSKQSALGLSLINTHFPGRLVYSPMTSPQWKWDIEKSSILKNKQTKMASVKVKAAVKLAVRFD